MPMPMQGTVFELQGSSKMKLVAFFRLALTKLNFMASLLLALTSETHICGPSLVQSNAAKVLKFTVFQ